MDFGDLIEYLFKRENRVVQRWVGGFLVGLPLLFFFGGGFAQEVDGHGQIFSGGWFREVFAVALSLIGMFGLLLLMASFRRRKLNDDD